MESDRLNVPHPENEVLRTLVDQLPAMVAYWDMTLHCRFANQAYQRWFGVSPESLLGKHISELLGPLYPLNLPYIEAALRGEPQEFEREIPDPKGGRSRHSLANYIPYVVDDVVRGFFVLVTDISEVKRTQLELRQSEQRFKLTLDEAPIGMAIVALDGRLTRVNRVLCELLGYTSGELEALTFQAITHPQDLDADLVLAGQLARGEIPRYQLEKRYLRRDGSVMQALLSGSVLRAPNGLPIHFVAQIQDITAAKRLEREQRFLAEVGPALASSLDYEETLARIAELSVRDLADTCLVEIVDDEEEVRRLKVVARDASRASVTEALMRVRLDRDRPSLVREVLETRRSVLRQAPSEHTLRSLAQNEDHLRALRALDIQSMLAVPLVAQGKLLGAITWVSSTPSHVYGAADVSLAEELARRATLSIQNARLYRTAQRATQARDNVLGIVAHDLRNPLSTILMQARLLRPLGVESSWRGRRDPAHAIERAALRMNNLIEDLLEVTRAEAGQLSSQPGPLPAAQVLADAVEAQAALAAAASIELRLDLPSEVPAVWADRHRLLQILENLLGNALKFTKHEGVITVGAKPHEREVLFWVRDTGSGIACDELPHLFDRFWQGRRARGGAGLGLPIVKGIVEGHGGRIWVESTPGQGSTFFFTLPRAQPELGAPAEPATQDQ